MDVVSASCRWLPRGRAAARALSGRAPGAWFSLGRSCMATYLRNVTNLPMQLPITYGSVILQPGDRVGVADSLAHISAALGNPTNQTVELDPRAPDGLPGTIVPSTSGAAQISNSAAAPAQWAG